MTSLISAIFASFAAKSRLYRFSELLMNSSSPPQIWIAEQRRRLWRRPDFSRRWRSRSPEGSGCPSGSWRAPCEKSSAPAFCALFSCQANTEISASPRSPFTNPEIIRQNIPIYHKFLESSILSLPDLPPCYAQKKQSGDVLNALYGVSTDFLLQFSPCFNFSA